MSEEWTLNVDHIDVYYGAFHALWDVSLEVRKGEIVSLIGANGSGKTTALNTIMGLVHPTKGSIEFGGKRIEGLPTYGIVTLGISQVPEGRRIFPELTVLENLVIGSYTGRARVTKERMLKRVYNLFPVLEERENQLGGTLSGGEQQMLAIGRALMSNPELILFDEISLGLAPVIVDKLYKTVEQINSEGVTVLFVEQNVRRSLKQAKRAYILKAGRVVLGGNAEDLREEEEVKKAYFGV